MATTMSPRAATALLVKIQHPKYPVARIVHATNQGAAFDDKALTLNSFRRQCIKLLGHSAAKLASRDELISTARKSWDEMAYGTLDSTVIAHVILLSNQVATRLEKPQLETIEVEVIVQVPAGEETPYCSARETFEEELHTLEDLRIQLKKLTDDFNRLTTHLTSVRA